jgi:multidrug efflux system membrane fusion protein
MDARRATLAFFLFLGGIVLSGCAKQGHGAPQGGAAVPPGKSRLKRNVELVQVGTQKMASFVETVGYLDAEGQTEIATGVSGLVEEVSFREGDWVIKDQTVLARIEPLKYEALLLQAKANLEKARANVKKMKASERKAAAACRDAEQSLDLRKVMLDNIRRAGRAAKTEERQEASAMVEVASARVGVAVAEKEVCVAEMEAAEMEVKAADAMLRLAQRNYQMSEVRAPYTGQINQRKITRGTHVEDKTVIATMADLSRLRLVGFIPEKAAPVARQMLIEEQRTRAAFLVGGAFASPWALLGSVATDAAGETPAHFRLEFELRPFPKQKFYGRIFYLSTVASPDTHLFECKAEVPTRGMEAQLRPGFTAKILCPLPGRPSSVVIPEVAVRASERGFVAFRPKPVKKKDGAVEYVAESVPLELGQRRPGWVEVLKGLSEGEWIVQKGAEALEESTPLAIPDNMLPLLQGSGVRSQGSGVSIKAPVTPGS